MAQENRNPDIDLSAKADDTFSAERAEDIMAILLAVVAFLICWAFPEQVTQFFKSTLYWI
ncbi:MAG: hypothetical protein FH756_14305 [Firmicutes bacterium]|nr:hypothetical protein [Bacillota bacterium]